MSVRSFDGAGDFIHCAIGSCDLTGALTQAVIIKRGAVSSGFHAVIVNHTTGNLARASIEFNASNAVLWGNGAVDLAGPTTINNTTDWYLLIVTKAAGTVTPRAHIKDLTTAAAMAHTDFTGTIASGATQAGGTVRFGQWQGSDDLNARIAVAGEWNVALSDAQCEELAANNQTFDWLVCSGGEPVGLWDFNQASVADDVLDLTGNGADESSITGTAVVADDPPSWVYGLAAMQEVRPDADVATTGWTSTPLFSKVNDESDGTVVTATLS